MIKVSAPNITEDDIKEAMRPCLRGDIDPGPIAEEFAHALAEFWGVPRRWVLLTNSCTTAIGVYTNMFNEKWVAPALTWPGTYCMTRGIKLVDVDEDTWCLPCPNYPETENAIFVNLYGRVDRETIIVKGKLIVDSAHCLQPARMYQKLDSGIVDAFAFSFGPSKEITTMRGGALVCKNAADLEPMIRFATWCRLPMHVWGMNGTITEVGAAMGLNQLDRYKHDHEVRREVLLDYAHVVGDYSHVFLYTHAKTHSGHLAVLVFDQAHQRRECQEYLKIAGIQTSIHYPVFSGHVGDTPVALDASTRTLSIPCHTKLTQHDVDIICAALDRGLVASRHQTVGESGKE